MTSRRNRNGRRPRGTASLLLAAIPTLTLALGACDFDEILEVDLPGSVTEPALADPLLAETLALSVQADFECGLVDYIWYAGLWYSEFVNSSTSRPNALMELRAQLIDVYADPCASGTGPVYGPLMTPRVQGARAKSIFAGFEAGAVSDATELLASISFYQGYAEQLMGEYHCGVVVLDLEQYPEGGPLGTREEAWQRAADLFTEAIAGGTTDVRNAALVGRARANLNLGNMSQVAADVDQVPEGFEYVATYSTNPNRRINKIVLRNIEAESLIPHRYYGYPGESHMTISDEGEATWLQAKPRVDYGYTPGGFGGVADPRVPIIYDPAGALEGRIGSFAMRRQQKYTARADPIPFATWREAQLMKAEALGGQEAIDIINTLRTNPAGLPMRIDASAWPLPTADYLVGASEAQIQEAVREERRRELFAQGTRGGDKLRWNEGWELENEYGFGLETGRPFPISFLEVASNPNVAATC